MKLTKLFSEFFNSEKTGGLILIFTTIISITLANTAWKETYIGFWNYKIAEYSINHWINEGFMTIFFLLIGLELEREIYQGELSNIKNASLPITGALGGMVLPAALFFLLNYGTKTQTGIGIPMATDIAFAVGILSLLGNKIPASLKIFVMAFAVIDDLGTIIIIAIFYTKTIFWINLIIALGIFISLLILNLYKIKNVIPYLIGGIIMWYFMLHSGVHATITGVLVAFAIPFGNGKEKSTSYLLQHHIHKPVAFIILPLFALANTCINFNNNLIASITSNNSLGIIIGLVLGKPLGIFLFCFIGVITKFCILPDDLNWKKIIGAGFLGGIGFTMSIFITLLAFDDVTLINSSKVAIVTASLIAGILGYFFLKLEFKQSWNHRV